ncbi:hypothetical protein GU243_00890 [Pseudarthrobacter psychrotolerans]|uniref:Uncharacterized protein n=1 Tax=Pseudarthrobacter psychrotolerans TaxID=2697569 RepID=A0A6P1NP55_9MICC|nr:hypothetical protein [Pseudarthrobacter psychrotolerans]QHK18571.1 hypothetical protein GU243_00890 [Pseudarthrobacter psychrotolerans]
MSAIDDDSTVAPAAAGTVPEHESLSQLLASLGDGLSAPRLEARLAVLVAKDRIDTAMVAAVRQLNARLGRPAAGKACFASCTTPPQTSLELGTLKLC